ncbi:HD domain-containing protein [Paludibaculum fermentans]|uniref:HD domain-containing protein n=1 Tax=Paludibaculum fermentans TaxID=1473598 RepID=A0A7S7NVS8_PALFE|nr:HD domain-containing protein [Paludibaculum fermentans]QOY90641.1 HD domain-containing protein [Paludibaculum fermentans]
MPSYREELVEYIRREARPEDKYGHQPRLYSLACEVGRGLAFDDDVVYAAAWLHDLGVFVGHRPEDPAALAQWDHVAYTVERVPGILSAAGFEAAKIPAVLEVIRTHQPMDEPVSLEAVIVRDADILEQLGSIGILRAAAKVGRDTRYSTFTSVRAVLEKAVKTLPSKLRLERSKRLAEGKVRTIEVFLESLAVEDQGSLY